MTFNPNNYIPKSIDDIVFGNQESSDLIHDIVSGAHTFPMTGVNGILLYGVPGTGKSALAQILPDAIEAEKGGGPADKFFVNVKPGSNGANVISQIGNRVLTCSLVSEHHYLVLDEVDNLTDAAMLSLKSAMNTPNTIFILTTNYLHKIEMGVLNRCHRVELNAAPPSSWLPLFKRVLADLGAVIPPDAQLLPIIAACKGSAREIVMSAVKLANRQKRIGTTGSVVTTAATRGAVRGTVGQILNPTSTDSAAQTP